ncbi:NONE-like protein [Chaetomium sp. MPI-SDFR-AT-0129]|nr:NONE-like protein [Chaetomium sp. MPI-SDFR-AT-0129]
MAAFIPSSRMALRPGPAARCNLPPLSHHASRPIIGIQRLSPASLNNPPTRAASSTTTAPPHEPPSATAPSSGPSGVQASALIYTTPGNPSDVLSLHRFTIPNTATTTSSSSSSSSSTALPPHAAILRTLAAPIHPSDVNTIQGTYGIRPSFSRSVLGSTLRNGTAGEDDEGGLLSVPTPAAVPGGEGCFEVLKLGEGVKGLEVGDWVVPAPWREGAKGFGTFRTHVLVEGVEGEVLRVVRGGAATGREGRRLSPVELACVGVNPCSAYRMLRDYIDLGGVQGRQEGPGGGRSKDGGVEVKQRQDGPWFIQNGANSAVGRAAIQLGRYMGLRSINLFRPRDTPEATETLRQELLDLGGTHVLTYDEFLDTKSSSSTGGGSRIREWTRDGADPVRLALDGIGGPSVMRMMDCLGDKACLVKYGGMGSGYIRLPTGRAIFNRLRVQGFWLAPWARENPEEMDRTVMEIVELMRVGKFTVGGYRGVRWGGDTEEGPLRDAVGEAMTPFRGKKCVFVFDE